MPPPAGAWTTVTTSPDGSTVTESYTNGRLHIRERKDANTTRLGKTTHTYDTLGRLSSAEDVRNGATTYTYTALDQIAAVTTPIPGPGQSAQTTTYEYSALGKLKKEILPDTSETLHEYWPTGDLKRSHGSQTYDVSYTYTPQGRMKTMVTSSGTTTWNYDSARGFLASKTDADSKSVTYSYKPSGRLWTRTWARGLVTTYSYNGYGDLDGIDYSDSTTDVTSITYDRRGRRTNWTDDAGTCTTAYNAAGSITSQSVSGGVLDGVSIVPGYDSLLRRNALTTSLNSTTLQTVTYGYDDASRLETVTEGVDVATYAYVTDSSLVDTITFAHNSTNVMNTKKEYDFLNRLTSITSRKSSDNSILTRYAYLYNSLNQRTKATTADNSYWNYSYDSLGQVTRGKRHWSSNEAVLGQDYGYEFDGIGNRVETNINGQPAAYSTNTVNEITQRVVPSVLDIIGQADPAAAVTVNNERAQRQEGGYFYEQISVANVSAPAWQSVSIVGVKTGAGPGGEDVVSQQSGNKYLPQTPEAFSYDDDGNMTGDGRWSITWDCENRIKEMISISTAPSAAKKKLEFKYDSQGRRIEKKAYSWNGIAYVPDATTRFVYDGWNLIAEIDGNDELVRSYRWGLDLSNSIQGAGGVGGLLYLKIASLEKDYMLGYDGSGNVVACCDSENASIEVRFVFGPFGESLIEQGGPAHEIPIRFSTKFLDAETDLYYYGFRYYNPTTGGWSSRDPIGEHGGSNLYGFVGNNAITGIDLFGLYKVKKGSGHAITITVEKCEILIVFGHQSRASDPPITINTPDPCSAAGAITCKPSKTNRLITHPIPNLPDHDELMYFPPEGKPHDPITQGTINTNRALGVETDGQLELERLRMEAVKKAVELVRKGCCNTVTIHEYRVRGAGPEPREEVKIEWKGSSPLPTPAPSPSSPSEHD